MSITKEEAAASIRPLLKETVEAAASESSNALADVSRLIVKAGRMALVALEPVGPVTVTEERLVDVRIWSLDNVVATKEFLDAIGLVETSRRRTMASYGYKGDGA